jgi:hypothetical protein
MVNQSPPGHTPAPDQRPGPHPELHQGTPPRAHADDAVARLLAAAAAPAEAGPQPGEDQALAAFRAPRRTRRIPMFSHPIRTKAAVAAAISAGTLLFAGVGGAAAGVLPDPAQDTASSVLARLGLDVPRAADHAGDHPADLTPAEDTSEDTADDTSEDTDASTASTEDSTEDTQETEDAATEDADTQDADTEDAGSPADPAAIDHGQAVSELAQDDTLTGADKGAAVSELASSKSRAGEDHGAPEQPGAQAESHKPDSDGDTSDDDTSDDDASAKKADGPATADAKSGGHDRGAGHKTRP